MVRSDLDIAEFLEGVFEFARDEEGGERDVVVRELDEREMEVEAVVEFLRGCDGPAWAVRVGRSVSLGRSTRVQGGVDLQAEPVCDPLYEPGCELAVELDPVIAELLVLPLSLLSCSLWVLSLQVDEVVQFEGRVVRPERAHDGERSCGRGLAGIGHPDELHVMLSRVP